MRELDNEGDDRAIAIAMLRAFRDMTQDEIAKAAELTRPTVSAAEAGRQRSREATFEQVLRGVDVDEELGTDLLRWVRRARLRNLQGGPLPDRHRADVAAAEMNDALEELFDATRVWMEERRRE